MLASLQILLEDLPCSYDPVIVVRYLNVHIESHVPNYPEYSVYSNQKDMH